MGNCQAEGTAARGADDTPAEAALTECKSVIEAPKPLWRIVVEEQIAAEAVEAEAAAKRQKQEEEEAAVQKAEEEAKRKAEEEEAETKRREEEAKKEEKEEEATAKAGKKKSAEGKPKKRVAGSPKKGSGVASPDKAAIEPKARPSAVEELKKEAVTPRASSVPAAGRAAPGNALDRAAIKEREKAFKERSAQQQEQLGAQLRAAAKSGNAEEVRRLLETGVVPNLTDKDGWTALMEASQAGSAESCSELLTYGADAKATIKLGEWGMTALHYAARKGHLDAAKVLLPVSDLSIKNFQGKTVREIAKGEGHAEIAKLARSSK